MVIKIVIVKGRYLRKPVGLGYAAVYYWKDGDSQNTILDTEKIFF